MSLLLRPSGCRAGGWPADRTAQQTVPVGDTRRHPHRHWALARTCCGPRPERWDWPSPASQDRGSGVGAGSLLAVVGMGLGARAVQGPLWASSPLPQSGVRSAPVATALGEARVAGVGAVPLRPLVGSPGGQPARRGSLVAQRSALRAGWSLLRAGRVAGRTARPRALLGSGVRGTPSARAPGRGGRTARSSVTPVLSPTAPALQPGEAVSSPGGRGPAGGRGLRLAQAPPAHCPFCSRPR